MCNCLCSVTVLCGMMMKGREEVKPGPVPAHSLLFSKSTKGPPGLTSPSDGRIAINNRLLYAFSTYILWKGVEFNPGL